MQKIKLLNIKKNKYTVLRDATILVLAGVLAWWAVGGVFAESPAITADTITFYDDKRGTSFTIGVDPASSEFGQFIFTVSGTGQYTGEIPGSIKLLKNGRKTINYRGDALFIPTGQGLDEAVATIVALNGTIEPDNIKATITISENSPKRQFRLVVSPPTGNFKNIVDEHTSVVVQEDLSAMYELTSGATLGNLSFEEFEQLMNEQIASEGRVIRIENLSEPQIESNPAGLVFFTVQQRVFFEKDEIESSQDVISVFLWEFDEWKFWFSEPL